MVLICAYSTHLFLICRPNLQVSAVSTGDKTSSLAKRPSPKQILGPKLKTVTVVTGVIKSHQESSGVIGSHQESPGVIRSHQESSGVIRSRLQEPFESGHDSSSRNRKTKLWLFDLPS